MGREKKKGPDEPTVPGWVVTYGDMMSLLLTFFVLLVSFSTISEADFKNAMVSIQYALGVSLTSPIANPFPQKAKQSQADQATQEVARKLKRKLQVNNQAALVDIKYEGKGGLKITLPDKILFDGGSADLKPEAGAILGEISTLLEDLPGTFIEVRGHTDNRVLTEAALYRDNYDLSYRRADAVARRIVQVGGVQMMQVEIVACGDGQPVAPNTTEEGRAANRRVDIYIRGILDRERIDAIDSRFEERGGVNEQPEAPGVDMSGLQER